MTVVAHGFFMRAPVPACRQTAQDVFAYVAITRLSKSVNRELAMACITAVWQIRTSHQAQGPLRKLHVRSLLTIIAGSKCLLLSLALRLWPDNLAREMNKSSVRQRAVAVCIDTRDGAGRNRLHGVAQYARRVGWRMMLVRHSGEVAAKEVAQLRPDGIIAYVADRWLLDVAQRLSVPLVDTALTSLDVAMTISLDDGEVARLAAEHLANAGLKHFGYCGVDGLVASEQRQSSFIAHLSDTKVHLFSEPTSEGESNLQQLLRWLKKLPKPIGLLVFDDKLGERVLTACRWANLSVPDEVAVLGIGDDELMCEVSCPTLSSVNFPTPRLGYEAAEMLTLAMQRKKIKDPHRKIQPIGVATRGSTDMVAVEDSLVKSAVHYIRAQAGNLIGVEQVAQTFGVSRRTLDRRFEAALGRTVHDELAQVRMQMAHAMLVDNSKTIAAVARGCGYGTSASFSRAFHQHSGRWPSEYRNAVRIL
jgi:LacI family transcriptional regulator